MAGMVFVGGAIGTMLRYLIGEAFGSSYEFPTSELLALVFVNLLGSYFLGLTARHPIFDSEKRKAFFGTGLAGGFTTMSALTVFIDSQGLSPEIALLLFIGPATYAFGWHQGRRKAKKVSHE
jgi:CrcB protein